MTLQSSERTIVATPLYSALFLAVSATVVLRIALNDSLLNLFMDYTSEGGSIVEKIHPASWTLAAVALVILLCVRIEMTIWELRVTRAILTLCAACLGLLVFGYLKGQSGSIGYLLDTYVTLGPLIVLFAFPPNWRRLLGSVVLAYVMVGGALAIVEFATHVRLMPYSEGEAVFRPTGLADHPLILGAWCMIAVCFVAGSDWPRFGKIAAIALLFVAEVVSGARTSTVMTFVCCAVLLVGTAGAGLAANERRKHQTLALLMIVLIAPVLIGGIVAAGGFGRFVVSGPDANAAARVDVYGVLDLLSWQEIMLGGDIGAVRKLVQTRYDLPFIESSIVAFIVEFGLLGTLLLLGALARFFYALVKGARGTTTLAVVAFLIAAFSNNTLSTKTSLVFLVAVLAIAFHTEAVPHRKPSW